MKIINGTLADAIASGAAVRLNLGVGKRPRAGFFGVDIVEMDGVDAVADLNMGLPGLPDNSVDEIVSEHVFEHVDNFMLLMTELHRVVKPGGKITITVPHYSNVFGFSDPTHVRFFGLYSMYYFVPQDRQPRRKVPAFYTDTTFMVKSIRIEFYRDSIADKFIGRAMSLIVNQGIGWQHFYERRLSYLYHANEITYVITPIK